MVLLLLMMMMTMMMSVWHQLMWLLRVTLHLLLTQHQQ
jgi:hypothetical protein